MYQYIFFLFLLPPSAPPHHSKGIKQDYEDEKWVQLNIFYTNTERGLGPKLKLDDESEPTAQCQRGLRSTCL